jgi:hypothetical protein
MMLSGRPRSGGGSVSTMGAAIDRGTAAFRQSKPVLRFVDGFDRYALIFRKPGLEGIVCAAGCALPTRPMQGLARQLEDG